MIFSYSLVHETSTLNPSADEHLRLTAATRIHRPWRRDRYSQITDKYAECGIVKAFQAERVHG